MCRPTVTGGREVGRVEHGKTTEKVGTVKEGGSVGGGQEGGLPSEHNISCILAVYTYA